MTMLLSKSALAQINPSVKPLQYQPDQASAGIVHIGIGAFHRAHQAVFTDNLIATGDSFMCDPERINQTRERFPTMLAVEMEGAAIAQTCHQLKTPFLVIRSLSDIAGQESPMSFDEFLPLAAKSSSEMVFKMLVKLII